MSNPSTHSPNAASVLEDCCSRAVACRLHLLHCGHVIEAQFYNVTPERVVLRVTNCPREDDLQPEAMCCVAFPHQSSLFAFMDCIKNVRDGLAGLEVHFPKPALLMTTNLRRSYRVPVVRTAEVQSLIQLSDGTRLAVEAMNISETGVEVELRSDDARVAIDTEIQFELRFRDDSIELSAIVRRRQNSRRALMFTSLHSSDAKLRVASLQRVVRSLEQLWLKSRRD